MDRREDRGEEHTRDVERGRDHGRFDHTRDRIDTIETGTIGPTADTAALDRRRNAGHPAVMQLRHAQPADAPALWSIFVAAVRHAPGDFYDTAQRAAWAPEGHMPEWFADRIGAARCILAEDNAGPLAFMALTDTGCLDLAYAHPSVMGTGVAGQIYDEILNAARDAGLGRLETEASHYARRFFARRGWAVTRRFQKTRNGAVFDQVEMALQLSPNAER